MWLSPIFQNIWFLLLGDLTFAICKDIRSSSIFKQTEVVFHFLLLLLKAVLIVSPDGWVGLFRRDNKANSA